MRHGTTLTQRYGLHILVTVTLVLYAVAACSDLPARDHPPAIREIRVN